MGDGLDLYIAQFILRFSVGVVIVFLLFWKKQKIAAYIAMLFVPEKANDEEHFDKLIKRGNRVAKFFRFLIVLIAIYLLLILMGPLLPLY